MQGGWLFGLGLFLPQLKLSLDGVERLSKQTISRHWLIQIDSPVPVWNVGESQPQVPLRHHRGSHPSSQGERCIAGHSEDIIRSDPNLVKERGQRTVRRHM